METTTIIHAKKEHKTLTLQKVLFICGILYPLIYLGATLLGGMVWEGYSHMSQGISELMAIGSPSRPVVRPIFNLSDVLLIAFALGIWAIPDQNRFLRIAGIMLIGGALTGFVTSTFFPMHLRDAEKTLTDTMHIILTSVNVIFILLSIGFAAAAFGKRFRIYSFATIIILLVFGLLAGMEGPKIGTLQPTPWLGLMERINIYGYLLWVFVLAIILLRAGKENSVHPSVVK